MPIEVYFQQQRRLAFEPLPRSWPETVAAIRAAGGAQEWTGLRYIRIAHPCLIGGRKP